MSYSKYEDEKNFVGGPVVMIGLALLFAIFLTIALGIIGIAIYFLSFILIKGYGWGLKKFNLKSLSGLMGSLITLSTFLVIAWSLPLIVEYGIKMDFLDYGQQNWLNPFSASYLQGVDYGIIGDIELIELSASLLLDGAIYFTVISISIILFTYFRNADKDSIYERFRLFSIFSEIQAIKRNEQSESNVVILIYRFLLGWLNGVAVYGLAMLSCFIITRILIYYNYVDGQYENIMWSTLTLASIVMTVICLIYPLFFGRIPKNTFRYRLSIYMISFVVSFYVFMGEGLVVDLDKLSLNLRYFQDWHKKIQYLGGGILITVLLNLIGITVLNYEKGILYAKVANKQ